MKMIYCTCNVSMLEELIATLDGLQIHEYQVIEKVTALSRLSDPRLDTAVWPGYNSVVMMQVRDADKVRDVINQIREMNRTAYNQAEKITACTWELDDYVFE